MKHYVYIYIRSNYMYIACMLALLASNVISYCMAVLLSCNPYILYTLYASVAGKQTILACMLALLTSSAISACMPALLASKLYGLVCQRCWQARYCGLYVSVAGKQAICACMHTYHQNIIQTSVVVLSSICTHTHIYMFIFIYERMHTC